MKPRPPREKEPPLVRIVWDDAEADPRWSDDNEITEGTEYLNANPNTSTGHLIKRERKHIVIAGTLAWSGDWMYTQTMRIPAGNVRKLEKL